MLDIYQRLRTLRAKMILEYTEKYTISNTAKPFGEHVHELDMILVDMMRLMDNKD